MKPIASVFQSASVSAAVTNGDKYSMLIIVASLLLIWFVTTVAAVLVHEAIAHRFRRWQSSRAARQRSEAHIEQQVNNSISQLQAAYWYTREQLREEASDERG